MKQVLPVFHGTYIRTVSSQLYFSFDTSDPFLTGPNLPKTLDQLIFCKYTLVFSKFLPPKRCKTLRSYYVIETKLHQFSKFVLIVNTVFTVVPRSYATPS